MAIAYAYYKSDYRGNILDVENFDTYIAKAKRYIDSRNGFTSIPDTVQVKNAICEIAEAYYTALAHDGIASESNDGVSVSYINKTDTLDSDLNKICNRAFAGSEMSGYRWC